MQGLLLLNKPSGITSFGAVAKVKRLGREKRVGHTGTLDPMATGVLPVLLGRATALSSLMLDADKRYIATVKLGLTTDTEDITGTVLSECARTVSREQLESVIARFTGRLLQKPPMYSALKHDGIRLYEMARKGETVDLPEREITVYAATVTEFSETERMFRAEFHVSKGTYIRSLARDIGVALGCGACLAELNRTYAGGFSLADCVSLDDVTAENLPCHVISEEKAVSHLKEIIVTEKQAVRFCNGGSLDFARLQLPEAKENELFRVKWNDRFLGVGRADVPNQQVAIRCVINDMRDRK